MIELTGDVDRDAEAALDAAYAQVGKTESVVLDFTGVDYINSTGIAVIVGLLARARAERPDAERARPDRALPPDLRDHAAGGLHDDPRREGARHDAGDAVHDGAAHRRRVAILDIQGDITSASEDALGEAYAEAAEGGTRAVVLNFRASST